MAKFADYVEKAKNDSVDAELTEVADKKVTKERKIPDSVVKRFDGKSVEDVLEAYANLQELNSRQSSDLGSLRKTVDQLLEIQAQPIQTGPQPDPSDAGITVDELLDKPTETITSVAKQASKETSDRVEKLERELTKRAVDDGKRALEGKYAGWENEITTSEFSDWLMASPARKRLFVQANQYDFDAANDLLELWYDKKGSKQQVEAAVTREQQFRNATLESSSPAGADVVQTYSRAELLEKRIAAKHGDRTAERYLSSHAKAIALAYGEGRITD